jgi:iron(III) transport system ATP-binding protein
VQLREQLKNLQSELGITTVYVTHDQEEALTMSDRIAVFNHGVIEQVGTPEQIYNRSNTEFVCTFVGANNRLAPALLSRLGLDAARPSYLRLEKVSLVRHTDAAASVPLTGTISERSYHGAFSTYSVDVDGSDLRVTSSETGVTPRAVGSTVELFVDPRAVLQY